MRQRVASAECAHGGIRTLAGPREPAMGRVAAATVLPPMEVADSPDSDAGPTITRTRPAAVG